MKKKDENTSKPQILGAVDLVHLNRGLRISLMGHEHWIRRRDFLKKILGAGAFILMPGALAGLSGCGGGGGGSKAKGESTCSCEADSACSCEADSAKSGNTLKIMDYSPKGTFDNSDLYVSLYFNAEMDVDSVEKAASFSGGQYNDLYLIQQTFPYGTENYHYFLFEVDASVDAGTTIVFKIAGTAKDINGRFLDGNSDGIAGTDGTTGDDFSISLTYTPPKPTCSCESDHTTCACQNDVICQCHGHVCEGCVVHHLCTTD